MTYLNIAQIDVDLEWQVMSHQHTIRRGDEPEAFNIAFYDPCSTLPTLHRINFNRNFL